MLGHAQILRYARLLPFAFFAAGQGRADVSTTADEAQAVSRCVELIRGCQLPDGAFAQTGPDGRPGAPVWIAPYFANEAALALLAAYERGKNPEALARVARWLTWCTAHQAEGGYWNDWEGTLSGYRDTGKVDAWDSSAALFLMAAGRYRRAGGTPSPEVLKAAGKAFACLRGVTDADGLTWAKPEYRIKFLMDNVEVRAGLCAATGVLDAADAAEARGRADRIARKLSDFWLPAETRFAHALRADGTFAGGAEKPYPHGLAQLFGIAFVAPRTAAWERLAATCQPETGPTTAFGTEWWLIAASRLGDSETRAWRKRVVGEASDFTPQRTYLHRPALAALALLDGATWMQE